MFGTLDLQRSTDQPPFLGTFPFRVPKKLPRCNDPRGVARVHPQSLALEYKEIHSWKMFLSWNLHPWDSNHPPLKHMVQGSQKSLQSYSWSGWWLNQPIWKICSSNWIISPGIQVENKKYLSCHHLENNGWIYITTIAYNPKGFLTIEIGEKNIILIVFWNLTVQPSSMKRKEHESEPFTSMIFMFQPVIFRRVYTRDFDRGPEVKLTVRHSPPEKLTWHGPNRKPDRLFWSTIFQGRALTFKEQGIPTCTTKKYHP